jgi:ankyrin repeat protein
MPTLTDKEKDEFFDACELGDITLVEKMLEAFPAILDDVSPLGQTALHHAAMYAQEEVVALLLGRGADISHRDPHGFTACEQAGRQNFTSICDQFRDAADRRECERQQQAAEALRRDAEVAIVQYSTGLESPLKLSGPLHLRK